MTELRSDTMLATQVNSLKGWELYGSRLMEKLEIYNYKIVSREEKEQIYEYEGLIVKYQDFSKRGISKTPFPAIVTNTCKLASIYSKRESEFNSEDV